VDLRIFVGGLIRCPGVAISEAEMREVLDQYVRLREDPEEWQSYLDEVHEFEEAALADLRDRLAADEGPEGADWGGNVPPARDG